MRVRHWLLLGLAPAMLLGCGTGQQATVPDKLVAHLPMQGKQAVIAAQHNVSVAQSNLNTAKVSKKEAEQFRDVANTQLDAANTNLKAARDAMKLGQQSFNPKTKSAAQAQASVAKHMLETARAKQAYANKLVELRDAKVKEQEAALKLADSDAEMTKVNQLDRYSMSNGVDRTKFAQSQQQAEDELAQARLNVAQLEGTADSLRTTWKQQRHDFNVASRGIEPAIPAPRAPKAVPQSESDRPTPPPRAGSQSQGDQSQQPMQP